MEEKHLWLRPLSCAALLLCVVSLHMCGSAFLMRCWDQTLHTEKLTVSPTCLQVTSALSGNKLPCLFLHWLQVGENKLDVMEVTKMDICGNAIVKDSTPEMIFDSFLFFFTFFKLILPIIQFGNSPLHPVNFRSRRMFCLDIGRKFVFRNVRGTSTLLNNLRKH